jgi:hypothetical protein
MCNRLLNPFILGLNLSPAQIEVEHRLLPGVHDSLLPETLQSFCIPRSPFPNSKPFL